MRNLNLALLGFILPPTALETVYKVTIKDEVINKKHSVTVSISK